jgi:pimeloyl-ACP methyl ester carboxylesterase
VRRPSAGGALAVTHSDGNDCNGRWEVVVTVVFVHGNPETSAVWGPLVEVLDRDDVICLSPPGFGAPVPEVWGARVEEYRDWLAGELAAIGTPVDLVGHDWGGAHVVNVAMTRPELLRSWCTDVIGIYDPDYVWHDLARVWQTPVEGEHAVGAMIGTPFAERAAGLIGAGMAAAVAERIAPAVDEDMARCILALYRSAAQPRMAQLGQDLRNAAQRPGLALRAADDHFVGTETMHRRAAQRAGARIEVLEGLGHWWMTQDPTRGAAALHRFWDSIPR